MGWDGDALADQMEEVLNGNRQRPTPGQTGVTSSARSAPQRSLESLRLSRSRIWTT